MIVTIVNTDHFTIRDNIKLIVNRLGNECNLNFLDISAITGRMSIVSMDQLFYNSNFNGDISEWDVSKIENMESMFLGSKFNGDISNWNVENVTNMSSMFYESEFNGDISEWDTKNVIDMSWMFAFSKFNGDISYWIVKPITDTESIFLKCPLESNKKFQPKIKY